MGAQRILIINGPNLNLLGKREPEIYGNKSFEDYLVELRAKFPGTVLDYEQSNVEGEIINLVQGSQHDAIILNGGGYSHTSVAIRDAIALVDIPVVEVHISNITEREVFRHDSLLTPVCSGCIFGFGLKGYSLAIQSVLD